MPIFTPINVANWEGVKDGHVLGGGFAPWWWWLSLGSSGRWTMGLYKLWIHVTQDIKEFICWMNLSHNYLLCVGFPWITLIVWIYESGYEGPESSRGAHRYLWPTQVSMYVSVYCIKMQKIHSTHYYHHMAALTRARAMFLSFLHQIILALDLCHSCRSHNRKEWMFSTHCNIRGCANIMW